MSEQLSAPPKRRNLPAGVESETPTPLSRAAAPATTLVTVAEIRAMMLEGVTPVPTFAEAVYRSVDTVMRWIRFGLPVRYVAQTPYVEVKAAVAWLHARRSELSKGGRPLGFVPRKAREQQPENA